jgi:hypothetical protein
MDLPLSQDGGQIWWYPESKMIDLVSLDQGQKKPPAW